ncbi:hypothetical protein ITJ42_16110 [Clavibacter michiganensis subsp. phaseoli]|uniref:Uncharacterized protein n=1 Tax=Clavibacter phaseoli TaxID=1734031 RepID=A0A8I0VEA4_9MICO|nr:hypothetical protein [Clavibacter phaseoli]MBF4632745.1 hypothetical protein [Clavibacter phaseoli]RII95412.1 hypothetical protein DZF95_01030 [Clavibacter michiganensis]
MSLGLAVRYLAALIVAGAITSQILVWLSWFDPLILFMVSLAAGLVTAQLMVVNPHHRAKRSA